MDSSVSSKNLIGLRTARSVGFYLAEKREFGRYHPTKNPRGVRPFGTVTCVRNRGGTSYTVKWDDGEYSRHYTSHVPRQFRWIGDVAIPLGDVIV